MVSGDDIEVSVSRACELSDMNAHENAKNFAICESDRVFALSTLHKGVPSVGLGGRVVCGFLFADIFCFSFVDRALRLR
jgi:hypothetical protein